MKNDCNHALNKLHESLEAGTDLDPESLEHLQRCATCRANLHAAFKSIEPTNEPTPTMNPKPLEVEASKRFNKRLVRRSMVIGLALVAACVYTILSKGIQTVALLSAILTVTISLIVLAIWIVRLPGRLGLYKRMCPGYQLSGVCLGLAKWSSTRVELWRLGFFLLILILFFIPAIPNIGIYLYVLLTLIMPVHPDDRQYLLSFRLARWWRNLRTKPCVKTI